LPDIITFQLFSGLLCIAHNLLDTQSTIASLLWSYKRSLLEEINGGDDGKEGHKKNSGQQH
jgi:hypothetical protein